MWFYIVYNQGFEKLGKKKGALIQMLGEYLES